MRIKTSGGLLAVFHGLLPPPSLLDLKRSVLQWSSVAPWGGMLLSFGIAKWLPGRSVTVQMLRFGTCFQDNSHLKGQLWLWTVCAGSTRFD